MRRRIGVHVFGWCGQERFVDDVPGERRVRRTAVPVVVQSRVERPVSRRFDRDVRPFEVVEPKRHGLGVRAVDQNARLGGDVVPPHVGRAARVVSGTESKPGRRVLHRVVGDGRTGCVHGDTDRRTSNGVPVEDRVVSSVHRDSGRRVTDSDAADACGVRAVDRDSGRPSVRIDREAVDGHVGCGDVDDASGGVLGCRDDRRGTVGAADGEVRRVHVHLLRERAVADDDFRARRREVYRFLKRLHVTGDVYRRVVDRGRAGSNRDPFRVGTRRRRRFERDGTDRVLVRNDGDGVVVGRHRWSFEDGEVERIGSTAVDVEREFVLRKRGVLAQIDLNVAQSVHGQVHLNLLAGVHVSRLSGFDDDRRGGTHVLDGVRQYHVRLLGVVLVLDVGRSTEGRREYGSGLSVDADGEPFGSVVVTDRRDGLSAVVVVPRVVAPAAGVDGDVVTDRPDTFEDGAEVRDGEVRVPAPNPSSAVSAGSPTASEREVTVSLASPHCSSQTTPVLGPFVASMNP